MIRVLASDGMENAAAQQLQSLGYEVVQQFYETDQLGKALADFDVLVVRSATKVRQPVIDEAAAAGRLKLIIRAGVGIDNIDAEYARGKGITVTNTPAASSPSVAELALGHMFALARYIYIANVTMRQGKWDKKQYEGIELAGKTLGLVGFGRIGQCLAQKAAAIGMQVQYYDVLFDSPNAPAKPEGPYRFVPQDELLATSDFVSLHCPALGQCLIGAETIAKMKDGAFLVNTSRGALVDETALLDALDSGKLAGAALDVFAEEPSKNERLYTHPKVSLTPHIAASTLEAQARIGEELVSIISGANL